MLSSLEENDRQEKRYTFQLKSMMNLLCLCPFLHSIYNQSDLNKYKQKCNTYLMALTLYGVTIQQAAVA